MQPACRCLHSVKDILVGFGLLSGCLSGSLGLVTLTAFQGLGVLRMIGGTVLSY